MEIDFIYRVIKVSAVLAVLGFLFVWPAFGLQVGWGFLAGAAWNTLNLWGLASLVRNAFAETPRKKTIIALIFLKFPVLYGGGALLLLYGGVHVLGALVGFSLPLIVIILKGGGRVLKQKGVAGP
jgi:hypothetical protein